MAGQKHRESLARGFYREETGEKDALKIPLIKRSCGTNVTTPTRRPGTHCWRAVLFDFSFCPSSCLCWVVVLLFVASFSRFPAEKAKQSEVKIDRPWQHDHLLLALIPEEPSTNTVFLSNMLPRQT